MKRFILALAAFLCLGCIAPQASSAADRESLVEKVVRRGALRVGFSSFVPWAMQNKEGKYIGFEIDVAERLAHDLGVKLQLVPTNWDGIIPAMLSGKFDVIIGGMIPKLENAFAALSAGVAAVRITNIHDLTGGTVITNT